MEGLLVLSPDRAPVAFKKASGCNVAFTMVTIPMQDKKTVFYNFVRMKVFTDFFFYFSRLDGIMYFPLKEQISTLKLHFFPGPSKHIWLSYPIILRYHDLLEVI